MVRVGNNTSATLILNTGGPSGVRAQSLPYSLFTHDRTARHDSNTIIKFADDTTVVGLIPDNDETVYQEEVRDLAVWCKDSNFSLNVMKTKGDDCGLQEKEDRARPHSHQRDCSGAG